MARASAAAILVLLGAVPAPCPAPGAAAEGPPPPGLKALEALAEEWFRAGDGEARLAVEEKAAALPPVAPETVKPISERLFALARKTGPRLTLKGRATLYAEPPEPRVTKDPKAKPKDQELGLYLVTGAKAKSGLLIAMHGGGEGAGDADSAMGAFGGAAGLGLTVIAPQAIDLVSSAWNEEKQELFVLDLVDAARRTLDVDTNRVYLAGHSMGGDGSWMLGGRHADRVAGAAPLAGSVMPYMRQGKDNRRETPRSDYEGLQEGVLPNLLHVPYWIYHSADDRNEAIHPDDIAVERLKALQAKFPGKYEFLYDRVNGMGHALPKGGVRPILQWLVKRERDPHPSEVVWETWGEWKTQMYWLHSRGHAAGWPWRYHAKIVEPNRVEVSGTTKPTAGRTAPKEMTLSILLAPGLFDFAKPLRVTSGGATLYEGPAPRTFWAMLVSIARRNDPQQWYEGHVTVKVPRRIWWDLWDPEPEAAK